MSVIHDPFGRKVFRDLFGVDEFGFADLPPKVGAVKLGRYARLDEGHCRLCVSHGVAARRRKEANFQRCWKKYRAHGHKEVR